jgi:hypothetical protein
MRRKSLWFAVGTLVVVGGGIIATLVALLWHEPSFYQRSAVPPGSLRKEHAKKFEADTVAFLALIQSGGDLKTGDWYGKFHETDVNSFFSEGSRLVEKLLPECASEPRLEITPDRIRLGFRYGDWPWTTVIAIEFNVWVAKQEPNVIVLELRSVHAGALPISAQSLLDDISDSLRMHGIKVRWFRHNGNPTAALKFNTDQPQPSCQVRQLELKPGQIGIFGHSDAPLDNIQSLPQARNLLDKVGG